MPSRYTFFGGTEMKKLFGRIRQWTHNALHNRKPVLWYVYGVYFYLFSGVAGLFALLFLGNFQQFLDESQYLILGALWLTVFLALVAGTFLILYGIVTGSRPLFQTRRRLIFFIISFGVNIIVFLILQFFNAWLFF